MVAMILAWPQTRADAGFSKAILVSKCIISHVNSFSDGPSCVCVCVCVCVCACVIYAAAYGSQLMTDITVRRTAIN